MYALVIIKIENKEHGLTSVHGTPDLATAGASTINNCRRCGANIMIVGVTAWAHNYS